MALLLENDDPDDVSVSKVIERAGSSKAALYRRWASREALLSAALDGLRAEVNFVSTGDPVGDVLAFFDAHDSTDVNFQNLIVKRQMLMMRSVEVRRIYSEQFMAARRRELEAGFSQMIADGLLRHDIPIRAVIDLVYGIHYLHYMIVTGGADAADRVRDGVAITLAPYLAL